MNAFEYANPTSVEDAVSLLADAWGDTEVLAGGTDLITSMKQGLTSPRLVVSLSSVKGLGGITKKGDALQIGATTTLSELVANADVQKHFPALVTAANNIGSTQMLNMGTVGGDLLQRPRCWYFRNGFGLLGTYNGKPVIPSGDNRYHAIFGNSGAAKFVNASSLAPGLIATYQDSDHTVHTTATSPNFTLAEGESVHWQIQPRFTATWSGLLIINRTGEYSNRHATGSDCPKASSISTSTATATRRRPAYPSVSTNC